MKGPVRKRARTIGYRKGPAKYSAPVLFPIKSLVPYSMGATLKYSDVVSVNPGAGTPASYIFRANGLYDCDYTGGGHQPRGFDQYMGLYQRYCVVGCAIKVTANQNSVSANSAITYLSVFPANTPSPTISSLYDIFEQPKCRTNYFSSNSSMPSVKGGQPQVTNYVNIGMYLGKDDPTNDDTACGDVSQNPSDLVYFHTYFGSTSTTADLASSDLVVELTFYVVFQRPTNTLSS